MQDRLEAVNDEAQRLEKQLDALTAEIEANPPKSIEDAGKIHSGDGKDERYAFALRAGAFEDPQGQRNPRSPSRRRSAFAPRARRSSTTSSSRSTTRSTRMTSRSCSSCSAGIGKGGCRRSSPQLLERYRSNQAALHAADGQARSPASAAGCFMALPSATLLELKEGDRIVECDNCGQHSFT